MIAFDEFNQEKSVTACVKINNEILLENVHLLDKKAGQLLHI